MQSGCSDCSPRRRPKTMTSMRSDSRSSLQAFDKQRSRDMARSDKNGKISASRHSSCMSIDCREHEGSDGAKFTVAAAATHVETTADGARPSGYESSCTQQHACAQEASAPASRHSWTDSAGDLRVEGCVDVGVLLVHYVGQPRAQCRCLRAQIMSRAFEAEV